MKEITSFTFNTPLELYCIFSDKTAKTINLASISDSEAFSFLKNENHVLYVKNCHYYLEWEAFEADLSADTLWHWGK